MKLLITVPTYRRSPDEPDSGPYDHPIPLGMEGPLPRLIASIAAAGADTPVAVIVAGTDATIAGLAVEQVRREIEPYRDKIRIGVFGIDDLDHLVGRRSANCIGLIGYGKVRNLQLLIAALYGADAVIGLDDDEEVPAGYLTRAQRFIGAEYAGEPVLGVVGPYREAEDGLPARAANPLLERGRWIRNGISALAAASQGLVDTPIGFGGNIVIHRDLFMRVPFDPYIPRGEDIDYITTCRMHGDRFWWDNELFVDHFPPRLFRRSPCAMLRSDIIRFIYSREKIRVGMERGLLSPAPLDPYPGRFLRDDLPVLARDALLELCRDEFRTMREAEGFVERALDWAQSAAAEFFRIEDEWKELTAALTMDRTAVGYVKNKLEGEKHG